MHMSVNSNTYAELKSFEIELTTINAKKYTITTELAGHNWCFNCCVKWDTPLSTHVYNGYQHIEKRIICTWDTFTQIILSGCVKNKSS